VENLYISEEKRKEEQRARTEAELKNLKSQLNPHFLFNTLNNIYALIAISQEKSQEAVMDLSKMLRYVLYESEAKELPINKEINFIENYVKLMKLRLSNKVEVKIHTDVTQNPNINIAPLLFITFIENAFKHGVSTQGKSFINFSIVTTSPTTIECRLENSYFPKSEEHDKSGSGIGMENLKRRLELIYPDRHNLSYGVEENVYKSLLTINCQSHV
jgi:LytS/YehU family sensor histidine kinase